jgi:hypothetical protein
MSDLHHTRHARLRGTNIGLFHLIVPTSFKNACLELAFGESGQHT